MTAQSDLLTVALVRYVDSCPPERHPDCPFVVKTEAGRTCDRECHDEITRLSKPGFSGVSAYAAAPYDPHRQLMSEPTPTPSAEWHTGSLLQMLGLLTVRPFRRDGSLHIEREVSITEALAMLARRGYDPDILLREGLAHALPTVLTLAVCSAALASDRSRLPLAMQAWVQLLEEQVAPLGFDGEKPSRGHLFALAQRSGFFTYVERWLALAPMEDLVRWNPVDVADVTVLPNDGVARWMIERFAMASLTDWGVKSLHLEHGWVNGLSAPVGVEEMFLRNVPRPLLDREIARRAVESRPQSLIELIHQALRFLNEGRRAEAAALFDAARIIDPTNAEAHNNFAFCMAPDEPEAALAALKESEGLEDGRPYAVNRVNQAVVLRLLKRPEEALAAAEAAWGQRQGLPSVGWFWCDWTKPSGPVVREVQPDKYLCELAVDVAQTSGDEVAAGIWMERLVEVGGPSATASQSRAEGPSSEA